MASWTNLTTTYTTNTLITVSTWNNLAGYSGNVQYLKDILDYFSTNEYVTYGYRTSASFVNTPNVGIVTTFTTIDTDEKTDVFPDEDEPQFFNPDDNSYRVIQKSGKYLLTAHYNPVVDYNAGQGDNQSQTFDFTINEASISKTNFSGSNVYDVGILFSLESAAVTPVTNFFMGRLQEGDILLPQTLDAGSYADVSIATFNGSNTEETDILGNPPAFITAKSPTVSTLFLNTPTLDVSPPAHIYSLIGGKALELTANVQYWEAFSSNTRNAQGTETDPVFSTDPTTSFVLRYSYYSNSWATSFDTTYSLPYTTPVYVSGTTSKSILGTQPSLQAAIIKPYYMIFAIKSFGPPPIVATNNEQNIFSIEAYDLTNDTYIGTPFQLTAYWGGSGDGLYFIMRLFTNVTQVHFPTFTTANVRMMFGLQLLEQIDNLDVISPKLFINNTEIASISSWATNFTTYNLDYENPLSINNKTVIGGVENYSVKGAVANNAMYSQYYFIGDYKLTDTYINGGITTAREKIYLWNYLPPLLSFTVPNYSFLVSYTDAGMFVGSWTFGSNIGLA